MAKKSYNFQGKRYTTWQDETSGVGGKYRPTTYGVYDNNRNCCVTGPDECKTWEEAAEKADQMNNDLKNKKNEVSEN